LGFVVFNSEVIGIGDGTNLEVKVNGNNLNDWNEIEKKSIENQKIITLTVRESIKILIEKLYDIEEVGSTALGPAILFAVNLIDKAEIGSKIILCTDGKANVGIGALDFPENSESYQQAKELYEKIGLLAKEKEIIINLLTFEGEESKMQILSILVEKTGGSILRLKPLEIMSQFSNYFKDEIIAKDVKVRVNLHNIFNFRNEFNKFISPEFNQFFKEIGNIKKDSEVFIEYGLKKIK